MNRGAAITIVAVLALTAGITSAAVDVLASYLWRPLPYPASDRLVAVEYPRDRGPSPRDLLAVDASAISTIADLAVASDPDSFTVLGGDTPFTADGRWIGGDVFAMFGVAPVLGRVFTREEASRGEPLAMIGYRVWQERFGGRNDVIGRTITVRATIRRGEPETFTIVGVLPRRFWHVDERTSLLVPLKGAPAPFLMRLRSGVSLADASSQLTSMVRAQAPTIAPEWSVVVQSARDSHAAPVRPMLAATGGAVLMLAIIAIANLAFLQMARGVGRQREMAVRSVLGASRSQLMRAVFRDSTRTGAIAAAIACALAFVFLRRGLPEVERYVGRLVPGGEAGSDPIYYLVAAAITVAVSIGLGSIMFAAAQSATLAGALAGTSATTDTPARLTLRQVIVAVQVAVAFCLLVGASLMIRTAWHLGHVDLGFEPRNVLSANMTLPDTLYRRLEDRREFFRTLTARLAQLPEVEHSGLTGWLPFRIGPMITIFPEGPAVVPTTAATLQGVDAGYFTALQVRLREGRLITDDDRSGRDNAAVISYSLARALWNDESPIGRTFRIKFSPEPGRGFGPYTIVGVVDDVLQSFMRPTPPQLYTAFYQQPLAFNAFLQIKTRVDPASLIASVERVAREMNPDLPLGSISTLDAIVDAEGLRPRLLARALAAFAGLAIVIAMIGLYAVSDWIAQLRQREAALRVALGADRAAVAALLAKRGLIAVAAGLVLGWIATMPLMVVIASEIKGVAASDLSTRIAVAMILLALSVMAMFAPAWRASAANLAGLLRDQ
jgi:putative ABC transport system permease protein